MSWGNRASDGNDSKQRRITKWTPRRDPISGYMAGLLNGRKFARNV